MNHFEFSIFWKDVSEAEDKIEEFESQGGFRFDSPSHAGISIGYVF